jgi:hypothetical protein
MITATIETQHCCRLCPPSHVLVCSAFACTEECDSCALCHTRWRALKVGVLRKVTKRKSKLGKLVCNKCYFDEKRAGEQAAAAEQPRTPLKVMRSVSVPTPSRLTPEQRQNARSIMKAEQLGQQGKSRSEGANARAVLKLDGMMDENSPLYSLSYDGKVKLVAATEFTSPQFVRQIHSRAAAGESLAPLEVVRTRRSDPQHMQYGVGGPPLDVEVFLYKHIELASKENLYTSLSTLQAEVLAATGEEVKRSTLHKWLADLRIKYGKKKLTGLKHPFANALIRKYIFQYAQLLRREAKGEIVLVWMDESYIHAGYCASQGWFIDLPGAVVQNRVHGTDKGMRIIIIHAMTRSGMVQVPIDLPSDDLGVECDSAAIVSTTLSADGKFEDYHNTLDGAKFVAWLRNRLIPAFAAMFGKKKKMCLILDNAKYHHARGADWLTPRLMKQPQLADALRQLGIDQITDGEQIWKANSYSRLKRGPPRTGAPKVTLMRKVLREYLESHAHTNTTVVQQIMDDHHHELLYTPPYESWLQPIELIWARVKHTVAMQSRRDRKYQETQQQTRDALSGITGELCARIVGHTEKLMTEWLRSSDAGSLARWPSLAQLVAAKHEEVGKGPDLALENVDLVAAQSVKAVADASSEEEVAADLAAEDEKNEAPEIAQTSKRVRRRLNP